MDKPNKRPVNGVIANSTLRYDLESERLEFEHLDDSYSSSSDFDCSLDSNFQNLRNSVKNIKRRSPSKSHICTSTQFVEDTSPELNLNKSFEDMKISVRKLRNIETDKINSYISELIKAVSPINDEKGMVKKCERIELEISKQEQFHLLKTDIAAIKTHLLAFTRNDRLDSNVKNKHELQVFILTAKTELSNLETYWKDRNIVRITEQLNKHYDESKEPNAVLVQMSKDVADCYSMYTNAKKRLEDDITRYQEALVTLTECDRQLIELEMKFKGFGDDGSLGGIPKLGGFGSASDSGMSDSGSEHELNEHEKRLSNLRQLANNLMSIMTPGSEALLSILSRIENNEKQLKELQQTCKDLLGKAEVQAEDNILDKSTETTIVETSEETKSPLDKFKDNTTLLWRTLRIAVPFYLAIMILCSLGWLEPQCCELQNNYKWSFALGLRYLNGPPPT